jgi:hypothetical protein
MFTLQGENMQPLRNEEERCGEIKNCKGRLYANGTTIKRKKDYVNESGVPAREQVPPPYCFLMNIQPTGMPTIVLRQTEQTVQT